MTEADAKAVEAAIVAAVVAAIEKGPDTTPLELLKSEMGEAVRKELAKVVRPAVRVIHVNTRRDSRTGRWKILE